MNDVITTAVSAGGGVIVGSGFMVWLLKSYISKIDGLIVEVDSNSKYSVWNLASPEIRSQVKKLRRIEKYKAWKKKGEEFKDLIEAGL